jgi:hypothetical protein
MFKVQGSKFKVETNRPVFGKPQGLTPQKVQNDFPG